MNAPWREIKRALYALEGLFVYWTDNGVKSNVYDEFLAAIDDLSKMAAVVWRNKYTKDPENVWQKPPAFFANRTSAGRFVGDCEDLAMLLVQCAQVHGHKAYIVTVHWDDNGHAICWLPDLHTTVCTYGRIDRGEGVTLDQIAAYYNKGWKDWNLIEMDAETYDLTYVDIHPRD